MRSLRKFLLMEEHVCPSWLYFSLNSFFRKLVHDPEKLFKEYVHEGDTALDIGCGPGFFTLGLAGLAGESGKVIAVDIQKKAIDTVAKKIRGTSYESRIRPVLSNGLTFPVNDKIDFALTFWMLHEVPDKKLFLEQIKSVMKPGAVYFLVEPVIHVTKETFMKEVKIAESCGMKLAGFPEVGLSRAAVFRIQKV